MDSQALLEILPQRHKTGHGRVHKFSLHKNCWRQIKAVKNKIPLLCRVRHLCNGTFTYIYFVAFSPISDTSPLLFWIIEKKVSVNIMSTLYMISLPNSVETWPQSSTGLQRFGYLLTGSIYAPKFSALSKIINLFK